MEREAIDISGTAASVGIPQMLLEPGKIIDNYSTIVSVGLSIRMKTNSLKILIVRFCDLEQCQNINDYRRVLRDAIVNLHLDPKKKILFSLDGVTEYALDGNMIHVIVDGAHAAEEAAQKRLNQ